MVRPNTPARPARGLEAVFKLGHQHLSGSKRRKRRRFKKRHAVVAEAAVAGVLQDEVRFRGWRCRWYATRALTPTCSLNHKPLPQTTEGRRRWC